MKVLAIFGPTGVGKTGVAVELAKILRRRGEDPIAINCDALQVYEGLGTLTGVADEEQQEQLEHRLIEFVPVTADFSVGDYMSLAHAEIDTALEAGRRPIVVGGTGLYIRALAEGLFAEPTLDPTRRRRLDAWIARLDSLELLRWASRLDPGVDPFVKPRAIHLEADDGRRVARLG